MVHLCLTGTAACAATYGTMTVQHGELVRKRDENTITELWAKPYLPAAAVGVVPAKHPPGMPAWLQLRPPPAAKGAGGGAAAGLNLGSTVALSGTDPTSSTQLFHGAPSPSYIATTAQDAPGQLYANGLMRVAEFLGERGGPTATGKVRW